MIPSVLSVYVESTAVLPFIMGYDEEGFEKVGKIQEQAWVAISQRLEGQFSDDVFLLEPSSMLLIDDQNRQAFFQSLHSRKELPKEDAEKFRAIVLDAYSDILDTQANFLLMETSP